MDGSDNFQGEGAAHHRHAGATGKLDVWLRHSLTSTYDDVLAEPLPDSWVRLIRSAATGDQER